MARKLTKKHWTYGGIVAVVSGLLVFIAFWDKIGGPVPLTKHSPTVTDLQDTDRDYKGAFQLQELEIMRINAEILQAQTARLESSIESDEFLMGQYKRPNLSEGDQIQKDRLIRRIEKHKRELDRLDKK